LKIALILGVICVWISVGAFSVLAGETSDTDDTLGPVEILEVEDAFGPGDEVIVPEPVPISSFDEAVFETPEIGDTAETVEIVETKSIEPVVNPDAGLQEALDNLWFPLGESLQYRIYWGVIPVGNTIITNELVRENGKTYLAIRFRAKSSGILNKVWPVNDYIESIVDLDTFLPIRFMKNIHEGRYYTKEITTFDHKNGKATWYRPKDDKTKILDIEPDTRDLISFMYYMRSQDAFDPGDEETYRIMTDEKIYDLYVKAEKVDRFRLCDYGWVPSVRLFPKAAFEGMFIHKGKMWAWVSRDPRRIITKVKARVPVASVAILISGVSGPGDDFWVKKCKYRNVISMDDEIPIREVDESPGDQDEEE